MRSMCTSSEVYKLIYVRFFTPLRVNSQGIYLKAKERGIVQVWFYFRGE